MQYVSAYHMEKDRPGRNRQVLISEKSSHSEITIQTIDHRRRLLCIFVYGFSTRLHQHQRSNKNIIQSEDHSLRRSLSSLGLLGSNLRFSVMSCLQLLNGTGTLSGLCFLSSNLSLGMVGFTGFDLDIAGTFGSLGLLCLDNVSVVDNEDRREHTAICASVWWGSRVSTSTSRAPFPAFAFFAAIWASVW